MATKSPAPKTTDKIVMPKLPSGVNATFDVGELLERLDERDPSPANARWIQLDDKTAFAIKGYVSDKVLLPMMRAEAARERQPWLWYAAAREFIVECAIEEHRATVNKWLDDAALPGQIHVELATHLFQLVSGVPFEEQPEGGASSG